MLSGCKPNLIFYVHRFKDNRNDAVWTVQYRTVPSVLNFSISTSRVL